MADHIDLDALAQRYLDLWQDQVSILSDAPELQDLLERMTGAPGGAGRDSEIDWGSPALWTALPALILASWAGGIRIKETGEPGDEPGSGRGEGDEGRAEPAPRPETSAAAAGNSADDLDRVEARLAAMEQRLDRLERQLGGAGSKAPARSRRRRS